MRIDTPTDIADGRHERCMPIGQDFSDAAFDVADDGSKPDAHRFEKGDRNTLVPGGQDEHIVTRRDQLRGNGRTDQSRRSSHHHTQEKLSFFWEISSWVSAPTLAMRAQLGKC